VPWFVIPANRKWCRNLGITEILVEREEGMQMSCLAPSIDIEEIRKKYNEVEKAKRNTSSASA